MAATKADVCLVLSKHMKEYIDHRYGVNSVLFANGIDKPVICDPELIKEKYGLCSDDYILSLGRIVPEKKMFFRAFCFISFSERSSREYNIPTNI